MIKKALILFLISFVLLTACSKSKLINFVGESDNWHVNYEVNLLDVDRESTNVTIKYIGENPAPKEIKYVIEDVSGEMRGEDSLDNGVLKAAGHSCSGCEVTQENEKINATITWNGKSETFILKNH